MIFVKSFTQAYFAKPRNLPKEKAHIATFLVPQCRIVCNYILKIEFLYQCWYLHAHFILFTSLNDWISPKPKTILLNLYQKNIHKVKFYPSCRNFTQALLVMLVTNITSGQYHDAINKQLNLIIFLDLFSFFSFKPSHGLLEVWSSATKLS